MGTNCKQASKKLAGQGNFNPASVVETLQMQPGELNDVRLIYQCKEEVKMKG